MAEQLTRDPARPRAHRLSYGVGRPEGRTTQPHGLSGAEIERLSDALHFMELHCRRGRTRLWWVTTDKGTTRPAVANVWKRIGRLQAKYGLPAYSALTFETRGGLHAHITFIGNREIARRLQASAIGQAITLAPIHDPSSLARKYLSKERTPQAGYRRGHVLGGRLKGSHRLDGGGDRVRLSRALERDAIQAGAVEAWPHTNARRSAMRKPYRLRRLPTRKAICRSGQIPLFPELEQPVIRLEAFRGGFMSPALAVKIEFRRRQHGLSQSRLGSMIGISQGHLANALRRHDPISSFVANRLREIFVEGVAENDR